MNKTELISKISESCNLYKKDAKEIVDKVFDIIVDKLLVGEKIVIPNFGSFYIVQRKARRCRNPQTDEIVEVPAKKAVKFNSSDYIKNNLND